MTLLKEIIYVFFANLINFNLYLIKTLYKKNFVYSKKISFGDTFIFYINNYFKIKKYKLKIVILSKLEYEISKLFFSKKNIIKAFFLIPKFIPVYRINTLLLQKKNFNPNPSFEIDYSKKLTFNKFRILLKKILKKNINYISQEIVKLKNQKFILIFVKHYNKKSTFSGSESRQTSNFIKIYKTINFILKKKIKVVVMGNKYDNSLKILKKKYFNHKKVIFFNEISPHHSIFDQLYVHYYSLFYIGSDSGALIISRYLKKKMIIFDSIKDNDESYQKSKDNLILFKKIICNKKKQILSQQTHINNYRNIIGKYTIKENSFLEIKHALKKLNINLKIF
jgi:putative glycosyltransferase (TIGR04372 family)